MKRKYLVALDFFLYLILPTWWSVLATWFSDRVLKASPSAPWPLLSQKALVSEVCELVFMSVQKKGCVPGQDHCSVTYYPRLPFDTPNSAVSIRQEPFVCLTWLVCVHLEGISELSSVRGRENQPRISQTRAPYIDEMPLRRLSADQQLDHLARDSIPRLVFPEP